MAAAAGGRTNHEVEPPTTSTTITNTALDMTAAEAIAGAEAEGAAARAEAAALGAAKRALDTSRWPTSQEEWAPTAAALTRIHEDLADTDLGWWRFGGGPIVQNPEDLMNSELFAGEEKRLSTDRIGATAQLHALTPNTPSGGRFPSVRRAVAYANVETPVGSLGSGFVARRPLWSPGPETCSVVEGPMLEEQVRDLEAAEAVVAAKFVSRHEEEPEAEKTSSTLEDGMVLEVDDLADLSIQPPANPPIGAVKEISLWDTCASVVGGAVHYANVERKAAAAAMPSKGKAAEPEISPAPSRPNRKVLLLEKKKRATKKWDPSAPLRRGRSAGPRPMRSRR